jgi:hypothetical protein
MADQANSLPADKRLATPNSTAATACCSSIPSEEFFWAGVFKDTLKISGVLFKVMLPMALLAKLLKECGAVEVLAGLVAPLMNLVGLPGSMGLVWATSILTNLYGGMAVFATLAPEAHLTVAQVTVLCSMLLVAHAFPVELGVARQTGVRVRGMLLLRLLGALALGIILRSIYSAGDWLKAPNQALWNPPSSRPGWGTWALDQGRSLLAIFGIILVLVLLLKILAKIGVTAWLGRMLQPILRRLGISAEATPLTVVGVTLGLSYGGGLLIQHARTGEIADRDVFFSMALLGLCHSLIEDTLVMSAVGAHHSGRVEAHDRCRRQIRSRHTTGASRRTGSFHLVGH